MKKESSTNERRRGRERPREEDQLPLPHHTYARPGTGNGRILSVISFGVDSCGFADDTAAATIDTALLSWGAIVWGGTTLLTTLAMGSSAQGRA